jgi:hypothetical protein
MLLQSSRPVDRKAPGEPLVLVSISGGFLSPVHMSKMVMTDRLWRRISLRVAAPKYGRHEWDCAEFADADITLSREKQDNHSRFKRGYCQLY